MKTMKKNEGDKKEAVIKDILTSKRIEPFLSRSNALNKKWAYVVASEEITTNRLISPISPKSQFMQNQ